MGAVLAVPHTINSLPAEFIEIETADEKTLRLTPDHLVLSWVCGTQVALRRASSVSIGDCIQTVDGQSVVNGLSRKHGAGVYSIVTDQELLVVSGVVASPYAVSHAIGSAVYLPHKWLYSIFPSMLGWKSIIDTWRALTDFVSTQQGLSSLQVKRASYGVCMCLLMYILFRGTTSQYTYIL